MKMTPPHPGILFVGASFPGTLVHVWRVGKVNPSLTSDHGSKKWQSRKPSKCNPSLNKGRGSKERQTKPTGGPTLRPGDLITSRYGTTNRDTSTGSAERTLLIICVGTTKDTAYYRDGLPVKTGFWCMHGSTRKFFVRERFVSVSPISVLDALKHKDSPLVLRATYDKDVQATQQALRKVNSALTYSSSNLGLHSQSVLDNVFWVFDLILEIYLNLRLWIWIFI